MVSDSNSVEVLDFRDGAATVPLVAYVVCTIRFRQIGCLNLPGPSVLRKHGRGMGRSQFLLEKHLATRVPRAVGWTHGRYNNDDGHVRGPLSLNEAMNLSCEIPKVKSRR